MNKNIKHHEEIVYRAVLEGELEIDSEGRIWRIAKRMADRWNPGRTRTITCRRRRAEHPTPKGYLQVRVMYQGKRYHACAHRLVWKHFNGPIPVDLTINHKLGNKGDNRPGELELMTTSEQHHHAWKILGKHQQHGELNNHAKLTDQQAETIRARRKAGEPLKSIAKDFKISDKTVSKIALGHRRQFRG